MRFSQLDALRASGVVPAALLTAALLAWPSPAVAQSLRGGSASLDRQNRQALAHDFTYLNSPAQVRRFAHAGLLVRVPQGRDYELNAVSFPYARPEVKLFIERLAGQFRRACGEKLVVTSLTRPRSTQPHNASTRSVHPTGMAVDLRRHTESSCRSWLDRVLVSLEKSGVLEATLERYPPHYHVAVYPRPYAAYVRRVSGAAPTLTDVVTYEVARRDTLWRIARRHGTTPDQIKSANGLTSTTIYPGQKLKIPLEPR